MEKITAFNWKLYLWFQEVILKRVPKGSFDQFLKFRELRETMQVDKHVLSDFKDHLTLLRSKFVYVFPAERVSLTWVQNPFLANIDYVEENFQK